MARNCTAFKVFVLITLVCWWSRFLDYVEGNPREDGGDFSWSDSHSYAVREGRCFHSWKRKCDQVGKTTCSSLRGSGSALAGYSLRAAVPVLLCVLGTVIVCIWAIGSSKLLFDQLNEHIAMYSKVYSVWEPHLKSWTEVKNWTRCSRCCFVTGTVR